MEEGDGEGDFEEREGEGGVCFALEREGDSRERKEKGDFADGGWREGEGGVVGEQGWEGLRDGARDSEEEDSGRETGEAWVGSGRVV